MLKIVTVVGTRPEIIKLSRVIPLLDKYTQHCLIHTGQNYDYELNQVFFDDLQIRKPDYFLEAAGENFAVTIGEIFIKSHEILSKLQPDGLLIYGDTNSCLCSFVAKRLHIPIFHMEAGNRCYDERVPEEINRKIIDHISDINITISEEAKGYLISEGIRGDRIISIGSSMREVINYQMAAISRSAILNKLGILKNEYFVVSLHREENVDNNDNIFQIINSLKIIKETFQKSIVLSIHPRTKKNLEKFNLLDKLSSFVIIVPALGFNDYVNLQVNSFCVISDSGTIFEESAILNFPAITLRIAHERPEAIKNGVLIVSNFNADNIINSIRVVTSLTTEKSSEVEDYKDENISSKVLKILYSYIHKINNETWRKF